MSVYYNENDPKAAAWLRELITAKLIPAGTIDTRSIEDVTPLDLVGYTQCHFFAGIGGWPLALALAGWPEDKAVWTGSCPCQPFSTAGKGKGFADERHLWPAWRWLISQRRPPVVFGEQVSSPAGRAWLDVVLSELEGGSYSCGSADLCAAGVGAPHIRQRIYWVALSRGERLQRERLHVRERGPQQAVIEAGRRREDSDRGFCRACGARIPHLDGEGRCPECMWVVDASGAGSGRDAGTFYRSQGGSAVRCLTHVAQFAGTDNSVGQGLDNADGTRRVGAQQGTASEARDQARVRLPSSGCESSGVANTDGSGSQGWIERGHGTDQRSFGPSSVDSPWADVDWVACNDPNGPRWRPIEPGTQPLAHGVPERVGLLRGYGNAIVPQVAALFIEAVGVPQ